jgi:mannose-6-phosphate isomerase-like protein (cupin superfamily)|tara:strand:- start:948 stop:1358 length:411 start_codon:yes stop_codon:yes gene_type:complete
MNSVNVKKKFNLSCPSWQNILNNLNDSVKNNEEVKHRCLGFFFSDEANKILEVQKVLEELKLNNAHLYINITENGGTYGRHCDIIDVYYWQVQGETIWKFDNEEYVIKPGDLITVPKGVYHNVIPLGPRVGVSMSI